MAKDKDKLPLVLSFIPSLIFSGCRGSEVPVLMASRTAYTTHYLLTGDHRVFQVGEPSCIATPQHFLLVWGLNAGACCSLQCPLCLYESGPGSCSLTIVFVLRCEEKRNERKGKALSVHCTLYGPGPLCTDVGV